MRLGAGSGRRGLRLLGGAVVAAPLLLGALLIGAPAAHAAPAAGSGAGLQAVDPGHPACDEFSDSPEWSQGATEYFDPAPEVVPPPLRPFAGNWDCATRSTAAPFPSPDGHAAYTLHFVQEDYATFVAILRSFEEAGWMDVFPSLRMDEDGSGEFRDTTVDELAARDTAPPLVQVHFAAAGDADVQMSYQPAGFPPESERWPLLSISLFNERLFPAAGLADPSVLSELRTIGEAALDPLQSCVVAVASVMLMLVVGWPGSLLNSVVGARYDKAVAWLRKRMGARRRTPPKGSTSWLVWPGFAAAAVIGGFVDPQFGPNLMSLRVLLSGLLSFIAFNLAGWLLVRQIMLRVQPGSRPYVKFRWGSLLLLLVAVLVARLLGMQPGVIFGLVGGLAFGLVLALSRDALVILLGSGFALVLAAIGWTGYSLLAPVAEQAPGNPALVFAVEFLSGMTIEGVSSLPLALLPLGALDGATLLRWKKWVWGLCYAVGLAAFMIVMFTIPDSFGEVPGDFLRWLLLFLGFAVVAVGVWALHTVLEGRRKKAEAEPEGA